MSSVASSLTASSLRKYGIPGDDREQPEITLLERLAWVRYKSFWWPAILYQSYREFQKQMYDQMDVMVKAQFAMAVMRQVQDDSAVKVARLLGRTTLEVVEVVEGSYCEFYFRVADFLPKACDESRYGGDVDLFLDMHRALDQVEEIFRVVSNENFALMQDPHHSSWLERAQAKVGKKQPAPAEWLSPSKKVMETPRQAFETPHRSKTPLVTPAANIAPASSTTYAPITPSAGFSVEKTPLAPGSFSNRARSKAREQSSRQSGREGNTSGVGGNATPTNPKSSNKVSRSAQKKEGSKSPTSSKSQRVYLPFRPQQSGFTANQRSYAMDEHRDPPPSSSGRGEGQPKRASSDSRRTCRTPEMVPTQSKDSTAVSKTKSFSLFPQEQISRASFSSVKSTRKGGRHSPDTDPILERRGDTRKPRKQTGNHAAPSFDNTHGMRVYKQEKRAYE